ncbi:MAG: TfoX family protein [Chitinophagaceae bacterium]|nr:MAG: TfoX family protein [Chitinophagaceae bacterium]
MSASHEFIEYVAERLAPIGPLTSGKFFGGHAFKYHGVQFAMIMGNTLYFCVNDATRKMYIALGAKPFSYSTKNGRVEVRKYFSVPEEMLEGSIQMLEWAHEAIASAASSK